MTRPNSNWKAIFHFDLGVQNIFLSERPPGGKDDEGNDTENNKANRKANRKAKDDSEKNGEHTTDDGVENNENNEIGSFL